MHQSSILPSTHTDLITDAAYDLFGRRLATASADQKIKVWRKAKDGSWAVEDDWKAHDAPISRIAWSHPEHGPVIASCSYDRTVRIWEENPQAERNSGRRWQQTSKMLEARGTVRDLAFAPSSFGLRLATISSDSHLRLYAPAPPSSSAQAISSAPENWFPLLDVSIPSVVAPAASAASHSASGSGTNNAGGGGREGGLAKMLGRASTPQSTSGASSGNQLDVSAVAGGSNGLTGGSNEVVGGGRCLSFCKEKWWGMVLAVADGAKGDVHILSLPTPSLPVHLLTLSPPSPSTPSNPSTPSSAPFSTASSHLQSQLTTISWAPSLGRSYHLLATGTRGGLVRIWRVRPAAEDDESAIGGAVASGGSWTGELVAELGAHERNVGKVEWNRTGTVLSSSGDDGKVRLWKAAYKGEYQCLAVFDAETAAEEDHDDGDRDMDG